MAETARDYQERLLSETVADAVDEGVLTVAQGRQLQARIDAVESMDDLDALWETMGDEYDLFSPTNWRE